VLQRDMLYHLIDTIKALLERILRGAVYCSVLQRDAACCSVLQHVAV